MLQELEFYRTLVHKDCKSRNEYNIVNKFQKQKVESIDIFRLLMMAHLFLKLRLRRGAEASLAAESTNKQDC